MPEPHPGERRPSREGQLLIGKYKLHRRLATGGMGEVYSAENISIGRKVAIKLLLPEHARNQTLAKRFLTEARAANIVRHPNVVDVLDIGQDEDGTPFIVQELLEGTNLARWAREAGGQLSPEQLLRVLVPVVEAVGFAHQKGVVHRDIKPENVFLARAGPKEIVPKLLDFGISHVKRDAEAQGPRLTSGGTGMGTPAYMSPEQVMSAKDADARTDVWAFGVLLYELLTGVMPFAAETTSALFVRIATEDPTPIEQLVPNLPLDVIKVVARCMKKRREERYATANNLAANLRRLRDGQPVLASAGPAISGFEATVRLENGDDGALVRQAVARAGRGGSVSPIAPTTKLPELSLSAEGLDPNGFGHLTLDVIKEAPRAKPPRARFEVAPEPLPPLLPNLDLASAPLTASKQDDVERPRARPRELERRRASPVAAVALGLVVFGGAAAATFAAPAEPGWPIRGIIAHELAGVSPSLLLGAGVVLAVAFGAMGLFGLHRAWVRWGKRERASSLVLVMVVFLGVAVAIQTVRALAT